MFAWRGSSPIPAFFTIVPDAELEQIGLPKNIPNSLVWVVYLE